MQDPQGEYPPRYRWLKRIIAACIVVLILLALTEWWWWRAAEARLAACTEQLRTAGEPASVDDLNAPDLPDANNAAFYLNRAASKVSRKFDSPLNSNATFNENVFPYSPKWFAMEEVAASANMGVFADLREARRHPRVQWTHFTSPLMTVLRPHLSQARRLANHACDYAMLLHFRGNDAEALEVLNDVEAEAGAVDQDPLLVSHLVATGLRALVTTHVQMIAPELTVQGISPTTNPSARPASRQQAEQMLTTLLDNQWRTSQASRVFAAERVLQMDFVLNQAEKQMLLRPMLMLDAAHSASSINPMSVAAPLTNWPTANAALNRIAPTTNPARVVGQVLRYSSNRAIETDYRVEEESCAAAVSLAVRLYRLDHAGALPETLEALVPHYLPAVPVDPMSPTGNKLGYKVVIPGKRAVVYSVGADGIDDTAAGVGVPTAPCYGWNRQADEYHELLRWTPAPSTQPGVSGETSDN